MPRSGPHQIYKYSSDLSLAKAVFLNEIPRECIQWVCEPAESPPYSSC